ncbi:SIR2 family protein [Pseudomonas sp. PDM23]|uniref:SIR2 family protein n=1 Tax=unclassified Pseudomonas TaxID=196821 RepID=UPI001786567F|nr:MULTISPECIES: SIR2 family protein [unclassified Pseudomonas]MBD9573852.1 SIR2 family protein [Pseudomonas sp. PDM23]MBD9671690.1 SIR2 family protein [Pseudomonas sp. PDM21]
MDEGMTKPKPRHARGFLLIKENTKMNIHIKRNSESNEFEQRAFNLLKKLCAQSETPFYSGPEAGEIYKSIDAFAPAGILGLPGPTAIEMTLANNLASLSLRVLRIRSLLPKIRSILLVTDRSENYVINATKSLLEKHEFEVKVIGKDFLSELSQKFPEIAIPYDHKLLSIAIESLKKIESGSQNKSHIESLKTAYKNDQLVLYLGAGVSLDSNLPTWKELLARLISTVLKKHNNAMGIKNEINGLIDVFKENSPESPLIAARILSDALGDEFPNEVRSALYKEFDPNTRTKLIEKIGSICSPQRSKLGLQAVVTYNYDEILEAELSRRSISHYVVTKETDSPSANELPIYHPHGFLPIHGELSQELKSALVLSENAYHLQFMDPYSWANITQLNLLRNYSCLFIGCSMTDPNQRRLLEISQSKRSGVRHYAILKDNWKSKTENFSSQEAGNILRGFEEASLSKLGVSIIWINDYNEIPDIVASIKE